MGHNSPTVAIVEGGVVAMIVGTWVVYLPGLDYPGTREVLGDYNNVGRPGENEEFHGTDLAYTGRNLSHHCAFYEHKLTLVYSKVECVPTKVASIA